MIQIYPTVESGLSLADYSIKLPGNIYPIRPRGQEVAISLSGAAVVNSWAKNNTGAQESITTVLTIEKFDLLESMIEAATQWIVSSMSKKYLAVVDIASNERTIFNGNNRMKCVITFTVVEVIA